MQWIAPTGKDSATATLEKQLWDAADQFRANSGLKAQEYSGPILGLIFLRFAEGRFLEQRKKLEKAGASSRRGSRVDEPAAYQAEGIVRFIKYYIDTIKLQMQSVSRGTMQDNLSLDKLLAFDLRIPPLPIQKRIAGILSEQLRIKERNLRRTRDMLLPQLLCGKVMSEETNG